ncbi:MAG: hypothetical protein ACFE9V_18515 [Candidatus Hodarchaeota archaeon]
MAIKIVRKVLLFLIFTFFLCSFGIFNNADNLTDRDNLSTSDLILPDKVYAFLAPSDTLTFEGVPLQKHYKYYLWVEIVTPHNCTLTITLWDPEGMQFDIFENDLFYDPDLGRYYEIPFGTALEGNYTIEFSVIASENLNLYIRIERGPKCLYDIIPLEEIEDMELYKVTRFSNGMSISHNVTLRTDYLYKFYVGRVSAISFKEDNEHNLDYFIYDPNNLEYKIYLNDSLSPINEVDTFMFGMATEGIYMISITIYNEVYYSNIAYAIIEHHKISHVIDPNQTDQDPPTNTTLETNRFSIPKEWTAGILIVGGIIIVGVIILIVRSHKRNFVNFKERNDRHK